MIPILTGLVFCKLNNKLGPHAPLKNVGGIYESPKSKMATTSCTENLQIIMFIFYALYNTVQYISQHFWIKKFFFGFVLI